MWFEWLVRYKDQHTVSPVGQIITTVYLLYHKRGFHIATERLVQNSTFKTSTVLPPAYDKYLPQNLPRK